MPMQKERLQITAEAEEKVKKLVEEMWSLYKNFPWFPIWMWVPSDEIGPDRVGCKVSFGALTVELLPKWWGTCVIQYKTGSPGVPRVSFAVHDGHPLFPQIKAMQEYAWNATKLARD